MYRMIKLIFSLLFIFALVMSVLPSDRLAAAQGSSSGVVLQPPVSIPDNQLDFHFPAPLYTGCGGVIQPAVNEAYEQQVVELVNEERAVLGIPPLKRMDDITAAARYHAADLGQDDYFEHDTYDLNGGSLQYVCSTWQRLSSYYPGGNAENIAAGFPTPEAAMQAWMNSDGHRQNILSASSWEIGVGYFDGAGYYGVYWVQDFGKRSGQYPLIINGDAADTDTRDVSVYIYGEWDEMRLRNDDGVWGDWQSFSSEFTWTLAGGVGFHTINAELRSPTVTASSSDQIYLTTSAVPEMADLPDSLWFAYSIADQRLIPQSFEVTPVDIYDSMTFTWSLGYQGEWFTVTPTSSLTPQSFWITPTDFITNTVITYSGSVSVTVIDPPGVLNSPQTINLTLRVIEEPFRQVFLPLIRK